MSLQQFATKVRVRVVGRLNGLGHDDIRTVLQGIEAEDDFKQCCRAYQETTGAVLPSGFLTGGVRDENGRPVLDFFKWLLEWLASPEGQSFIKFIFSLFGFILV